MEEEKLLEAPKTRGLGVWWERMTGERLTRWEKIIGIVMLLIFLFVFYIALDANKIRAQVRAIEGEGKVGINPTTELLDFGDLSRGASAVRVVTVENNFIVPYYIGIVRMGGVSDLVELNRNNFILQPGEEYELEFTAYMPASAEIDKVYSGRVYIFKIPAPFTR